MNKTHIWFVFIASVIFHYACQQVANKRSKDVADVKLPDLFHDYIDSNDYHSDTTEYINDIIPVAVALFFVYKCISERKSYAFHSFLLALSVMYTIRAILFVSTTLPDPSGKCDPDGLFGTCSDLIFSGHIGLTMISLLYLHKYFYGSALFSAFSALLLFVMSFFVLLNNNHYTVDVILALIIPFFIYVWASGINIGGKVEGGLSPSLSLCQR